MARPSSAERVTARAHTSLRRSRNCLGRHSRKPGGSGGSGGSDSVKPRDLLRRSLAVRTERIPDGGRTNSIDSAHPPRGNFEDGHGCLYRLGRLTPYARFETGRRLCCTQLLRYWDRLDGARWDPLLPRSTRVPQNLEVSKETRCTGIHPVSLPPRLLSSSSQEGKRSPPPMMPARLPSLLMQIALSNELALSWCDATTSRVPG